MTEEKFDLRRWLGDVDISRIDDSLDEEAKRLFVLNDALVNPASGPIIAALIVTADQNCGLDALTELADCTEPRLAMMAIVNVLNVLTQDTLDETKFTVPDETSGSETEPETSVVRDGFPSRRLVRSKVAEAATKMSKLFVEKVAVGDFCPDFLTFLLTALMNLSVPLQQADREGIGKTLMSVPNERFLKTILRTWKSPELHEHLSQTGGDNQYDLGFLVTCYIRSLCTVYVDDGDSNSEREIGGESQRPTGLNALVRLGDWAVKFFLMRLYSPSSTAIERAQLMSIMNYCGKCSAPFTNELIRALVLNAIARTGDGDDFDPQDHRTMSYRDTTAYIRLTIPAILLLNHISNYLLRESLVPGSGVWFEGKQSSVTIGLYKAFLSIVKRGLCMVILSDFPSSEQGRAESIMVISLVSHLIAQVWKAGTAVLFRAYNDAQRPLRQAFLDLFEILGSTVEELCLCRNWTWLEVSRLNRMATLQVGVNLCKSMMRNAELWERMATSEEETETFLECRSGLDLCEWCLRRDDNNLMTCGHCKRVSYCCAEHQRAHWAQGHKAECRFFRNCLEGSSFSYRSDGKLCGLQRAGGEASDRSTEAPFSAFIDAQRRELLVLGHRMPGVMIERGGPDGMPLVFYDTKLAALRIIAEHSRRSHQDVNMLVAESLMSASRNTSSLLYISHGLRNDLRTLSLHCAAEEHSQTFSVKLLP